MEHLPVEVLGYILSLLDYAEEVIVASATCKKWREARHNHLHALSFEFDLQTCPRTLELSEVEIIITRTVLQTKGLQRLSIRVDFDCVLSPATVIAWLIHTRGTLRKLYFCARNAPSINILQLCNRQNLELIELYENSIASVAPVYMKFSALKSLYLTDVSISALDLSLLLAMCPILERLSLVSLIIAKSDAHATVEFSSASLKDIFIESIGFNDFKVDNFILEAASIKNLWLRECTLKLFKFVGKGSLEVLQFEDVTVCNIDIDENIGNLEVVDVSYTGNPDFSNFTIMWPKFYHMISRSTKLRSLRLWDIVYNDEDEVVQLETISACFPQLTYLSLKYGLRDGRLYYGTQGSSLLQNVTVLEVGWTVISKLFTNWVDQLLQRCPRLKKLVIFGTLLEARTHEDSPVLAEFTTSIFRLMRKYACVDVLFEFKGKLRSHPF